MPRISKEKRKLIVHKWCSEDGLSLRQLGKSMNVSVNGAKKVIKKFCEHNTLEDMPKPGRTEGSVNPEVNKKIVTLLKKNCSMSTREIADRVHVNVSTVQKNQTEAQHENIQETEKPKKNRNAIKMS
ncbi:hypothetical protein ILUMI_07380 [Ignelater luminosus]|uniref:Uncharacterized protein n=1 Tax=Ignelater luminosus TaxID=2038154 RepID=A0A8K0DDM4_IGNLU|nr:hypothetical protein ILUMI_07380 [Ignelater luminosus]